MLGTKGSAHAWVSCNIKCFHCLMDSGCSWGNEGLDPGPEGKQKKLPEPQRQLHGASKSHLGSAPSLLTYSSKTSPTEPKLRLISKANMGTYPFSVPGLFYISPWGFLNSVKSASLRSPLLSQQKCLFWSKRKDSHQKHSALHIAGLHVFCDCNSHE